MRVMRDQSTGTKLNVIAHIITSNGWEYYVTTDKFSTGIYKCLVMGFETELGDVDLEELKPHVIGHSTNLNGLAPAIGWIWERDYK